MNTEHLLRVFKHYNIECDENLLKQPFIFCRFHLNKLVAMDFENITDSYINKIYTDNQKYYHFSPLCNYLIISENIQPSDYNPNIICLHINETLDIINVEFILGDVDDEGNIKINYDGVSITIDKNGININNTFTDKYFIIVY